MHWWIEPGGGIDDLAHSPGRDPPADNPSSSRGYVPVPERARERGQAAEAVYDLAD
jgi:hypothetical protein